MSKLALSVGVLSFLIGILSYADPSSNDKFYQVKTEAHEIKIMAYNVQNLFDADHDEDKDDYEFLPVDSPLKDNCSKNGGFAASCKDTNWTHEKVANKILQIKKALDLQGDHPDVLMLSEVENSKVISQLAEGLGYSGFEISNSPDKRGIDCAVLYKTDKITLINFKEKELEKFPFPTRNLSVAHFRLKDGLSTSSVLAVYPVHWPSQRTEDSGVRINVANQLKGFIRENSKSYRKESYHVVVLGDFNTVEDESPHPIDDVFLKPDEFGMFDVKKLAEIKKNPYLNRMPQGTYYYGKDKAWNEFDHIIISSNLMDNSGFDVDAHSYRINAPLGLSKTNDAGERIPFRFNHKTENPKFAGYSDHFGVHVKFVLK